MIPFFVIIAGIFLGDLWIKNKVEKNGIEGQTKEIMKGKLLIRKHHNRGAVLNVGQHRRIVVAALSLGLCVCCTGVFCFSLTGKGNTLLKTGLALLLGGAYSNTYDRLKRKYVVDYFSIGVKWQRLRSIIFNISDFCIAIGAVLCIIGAED